MMNFDMDMQLAQLHQRDLLTEREQMRTLQQVHAVEGRRPKHWSASIRSGFKAAIVALTVQGRIR